jgi:hypothetical protein
MIDIKNLLVPEKQTSMGMNGFPGFTVDMVYLGPERIKKLQKACQKTEYDRKLKMVRETLDEDLFSELFAKAVIKGWTGLNLGSLEELALVDIGEQDPEIEVHYTEKNAEALLRNSVEFTNWINEVVFDLANFRRKPDAIPAEPDQGIPES